MYFNHGFDCGNNKTNFEPFFFVQNVFNYYKKKRFKKFFLFLHTIKPVIKINNPNPLPPRKKKSVKSENVRKDKNKEKKWLKERKT